MNCRVILVCVLVVCAWGVAVGAVEAPLPARVTPVVLAARKAGPAVVNISTERIVVRRVPGWGMPGMPLDDLFDWPPRTRTRTTGVGSGAIVADTGYILTNAHVVTGATEIRVSLADKTRLTARLISADPTTDLAVIKVEPPAALPFIEMGVSSDLMPGETVVALGNPFGYGHTVTVGVISAVKRDIVLSGRTVYKDLIQTDAAINPGSSGGPLVNAHGQLIGINTAIRVQAQNIGFAIPVDRVRQALVDLLDFRTLNHTWLGAVLSETCRLGPPVTRTVCVKAVEAESPAATAGLAPDDVVLALDGRAVRSVIDVKARLLEKRVGDVVRFTVRRGTEQKTFPVTLAKAPRKPVRERIRDRLGLVVQDLTPELAKQLRLSVRRGLLVAEVVKRGPAAAAGIRQGDVIVQAGSYRLERVEELGSVLERLRKGQSLRVGIVRGRFLTWVRLTAW